MAKGDVVQDQQKVAVGTVMKIKPSVDTQEWSIHNIYTSGSAALIKCKLFSVTGEAVGAGDGSTTQFTLANVPVEEYSETIYVDGVAQTRDTDYSIDYETGVITFTTAPADGASITADYQYRLEVEFDTVSDGGWLYYVFHITHDNYLRVKNIDLNEIVIGYDGVITKG